MSNFIRDITARSRDVPLNGLPTLYSLHGVGDDNVEPTLEQSLFTSEPVQEINTYYSNLYQNRVDTLRTKTETWYDYLNGSRVPFYIEDPVQCRVLDDPLSPDDGTGFPKPDNFIIEDHKAPVGVAGKTRLVYKLNFDPFTDKALARNISFNEMLNVISDEGDTAYDLAMEYGFNAQYAINDSKLNYNWDVERGLPEIKVGTALKAGTVLITNIRATQKKLFEAGLVKPFLFFINGLAIKWSRVTFAGDRNDLYVIIDASNSAVLMQNAGVDVDIKCVGFPFSVRYVEKPSEFTNDLIDHKDLFCWLDDPSSPDCCKIFPSVGRSTFYGNYVAIYPSDVDDYFIEDIEVEVDRLYRSHKTANRLYWNYHVVDGSIDYTNKIKQFNVFPFLPAEKVTYNIVGKFTDRAGISVKWTPFNHLNFVVDKDILDSLGEVETMKFRIITDKRVRYDQDNVLRMWNKARIESDYENYVESLDATIELFIQKIYELAQNPSLEIKFYQAHFDNMEEGSTPVDEFIYYTKESTNQVLKDLAADMFENDSAEVKACINGIIDDAYILVPANEYAFDEWSLRLNLPEMFVYGGNLDLIINNIDLLTKVFDFRYSDRDQYFRNFNVGTNYIVGYDPDKIESSILHSTFSVTMTGHEVYDMVIDETDEEEGVTYHYVYFPTPNSDLRESHLMLFHDGLLYPNYKTIEGMNNLTIRFSMEQDVDVFDDDSVWELVWFTNVTNEVLPVDFRGPLEERFVGMYDSTGHIYTSAVGISNLPCNTSIVDPENLVVMIDKFDDNIYNARIEESDPMYQNVRYPIFYRINSYDQYQIDDGQGGQITMYDYKADPQINGVHRITKLGGGDYFILPRLGTGVGSLPNRETFANPDRNIFDTDTGLDSHAFAFCSGLNTVVFNGTKAQWGRVATDSSWSQGIPATVVTCDDGDVVIGERVW